MQRVSGAAPAPRGAPVEDVTLVLGSRLADPHAFADQVLLSVFGLVGLAVGVVVARARPDEPAARLLLLAGGAFALHLFLVFPAPHPALIRLQRVGPAALRRVGGATV